jgi:predicted nucleic-acid-binding protein
MIGIDTNVLLRLSDKTDPAQSQRARALVSNQGVGGCFVNEIVLAEYTWTLKRTYKQSRAQIAEKLDALLTSREFIVSRIEDVRRALERYSVGPADFADYLLAEINRAQGCTQTATFDTDALLSGDPFSTVPHLSL